VTFTTTHFSHYAVAYVKKTFADLETVPWAKKQIEVLASKGIINGTSADTYSPGKKITRADYLVLLVKSLGLAARVEDNFDDIKEGSYYYDEVGIAKKLGLTRGVGNNLFTPQAPITRQDMMVFTEKALSLTEKTSGSVTEADLKKFKDKSLIAPYAVKSAAALVQEGLVSGWNHMLAPLRHTTRAEAAALLYRIYNHKFKD